MNVNMNNAFINMANNMNNKNGMGSLKDVDKSSFINMMLMMMQNGNITADTSQIDSNIIDVKTKDLILGSSLNQNEEIPDSDVSNSEILNMFGDDKKEDNKDVSVINDKLMTLMFGNPQDITNTMVQNLMPKDFTRIINQNVQESTNTNDYNSIIENPNAYENSIQQLDKSKLFVNDQLFKNKFIVKSNTINEQNANVDKSNAPITNIDSKVLEETEGINQKANLLNEVLFDDAKINKQDYKEEIDFSKIVVENKRVLFTDNNKIIKVSDEASQIKSSVLSQIKDQIIIMDKDGVQNVSMKLFPDNLGKIDIKMSYDKQKMTVEIIASSKATEKILISHADELISILNKSNDTSVNVLVKPYVDESRQYENNFTFNYQNNENGSQSNKRNYTYNQNTELTNDEESIISEMINLRNLQLNKVV